MGEGLVSVGEAAKFLGVSEWTLRAWIAAGRIEVVRLGRRVLVERAYLANLIARNRVPEQRDPVAGRR